MRTLGRGEMEQLWKKLSQWQAIINLQSEQFSGEVLLERQEELKEIRAIIGQWTELSLAVLRRHQEEGRKLKQHQQQEEEGKEEEEERQKEDEQCEKADGGSQQSMVALITYTEAFTKQLATRTSGENGTLCTPVLYTSSNYYPNSPPPLPRSCSRVCAPHNTNGDLVRAV